MLPTALAAFVAGVFLLQQQAVLPAPAMLAALMLGALALRGRRQQDAGEKGFAAAVLVTCACAVGFAYAGWRAQQRLEVALPPADKGRNVEIVGIVAGLPAAMERGQRFEFEVEAVATVGASVPPRLSLAWYVADAAVAPGERWAFTAHLRRPRGSFNPGGFDLGGLLLERGLRASGYVREKPAPRRLAPMVWTAPSAIDGARAELRSRLQARVSGLPLGGVLTALVLGDQRAISEADWLLFNRTSISHLVSISGLHVTMISGLVALLTGRLWRRSEGALAVAPAQHAAAVATVLAAFGYCLLAGWGRAGAAHRLHARHRRGGGLAAPRRAAACHAGAGGLRRLPARPVGGDRAGLLAVLRCRGGDHGHDCRAADRARAGLADAPARGGAGPGGGDAGAAAADRRIVPAGLGRFDRRQRGDDSAGQPAGDAAGAAGRAAGALPEPLSLLAAPCLALANALLSALHPFLTVLAAPSRASLPLPAPPGWTLAMALAGVAWLLAPPGWPLRRAGGAWLLPMLVWQAARPADGELWVTALDVGQGAAVLVESRRHVVLCDTGPRFSGTTDAGSRIVLPYLRGRGIGALDLLVVSHLDSDNSGGAASILRGTCVDAVLTSVDPSHPALRGAGAV